MRKLLLWMATMCVGGATFVCGLVVLSGSASAFFAGFVLWVLALAFGLALSAPAFMDPPDDGGGLWYFRLPLALWLMLMVLKLMSWVGFYILLGSWMLIFHFWNGRNSGRRPSFSGAPAGHQQPVQPGYGHAPAAYPQQRAALPPASWQNDPSGRYTRRYWDGMRWTDQVANGNVRFVDPL